MTQGAPNFSKAQLKMLTGPLKAKYVQIREADGRRLSYVEGWYAVSRANAIFGYSGWDRETIHLERVHEQTRPESLTCGYLAKVRITVRAGSTTVVRDGTGWGWATARSPTLAHERASKAAETDATKRALSTFGPQFGLNLYDPERGTNGQFVSLYGPDGKLISDDLSPESFSTGLRQLIERCSNVATLNALATNNHSSIIHLRKFYPGLRNIEGTHFADLLGKLFDFARRRVEAREGVPDRCAEGVLPLGRAGSRGADAEIVISTSSERETGKVRLEEPRPLNVSSDDVDKVFPAAAIGVGSGIDKSLLAFGSEKRLRDVGHLRRVGELPCMICSRQPSHAHHLRFAQRRGLSQKVGDQFVVPLCALHHGDLHRENDEKRWWERQAMDPLPVAAELWDRHKRNV